MKKLFIALMLLSTTAFADIHSSAVREDGSSIMLSSKPCLSNPKEKIVFAISETGKIVGIGCALDYDKTFIWVTWQDDTSYFYSKSAFKPIKR